MSVEPSREIYNYKAPWNIYGLSWSNRPKTFRLGLSSFIQDYCNKLVIVQMFKDSLVKVAEADHHFPITKLKWSPFKGAGPELLATTGDMLRLWEMVDPDGETENPDRKSSYELRKTSTLCNIRKTEQCAPITSFDWNDVDPKLLITCSIDTTCTLWDLQTQVAKTQLIAHDKEVYDVAFSTGTDIFASVGADGSVRMFDLRALEHSTIIYESPLKNFSGSKNSSEYSPLLRLSWNKQDPNYIATFQVDSSSVIILDQRVPAVPVAELNGHLGPINAIGWAPHSSGHLCSTGSFFRIIVGNDGQALIWDVSMMARGKNIQEPILAYTADAEVNQFSWCNTATEWVSIAFGNTCQALRV